MSKTTQSDQTTPTTTSPKPTNSIVTVESSLGWDPDQEEHRRAFIIENWDRLCDWGTPQWWVHWLKTGEDSFSKPTILKPVK